MYKLGTAESIRTSNASSEYHGTCMSGRAADAGQWQQRGGCLQKQALLHSNAAASTRNLFSLLAHIGQGRQFMVMPYICACGH